MAPTTPRTFPGIQHRDTLPAGLTPTWVVTGDFNRDGHADFIIANGVSDELWIYIGKGDGTFALPRTIPLTGGRSPVCLATADLRGIGVLDLLVAESDSESVGVMLGNGDGTFGLESEIQLSQPPTAIAVDDFNKDGKADFVVTLHGLMEGPTNQSFAVFYGDGTGKFNGPGVIPTRFYQQTWNVSTGDVNGDGFPDVLISGPGFENAQVFLSDKGNFDAGPVLYENSGFNSLLDARFADVDEDGCLDGLVADANGNIEILLGDCQGNFGPPSIVHMGVSNSALKLEDVNGDGHLDIITTGIASGAAASLGVAYGDGKGHFMLGRDYVGTGESYSLATADFNEDGKPDIVATGTDTDTATVYLNDGSGGFGWPQGQVFAAPGTAPLDTITPLSPYRDPSFIDLNGDSKPDMVFVSNDENNQLAFDTLLNDGSGRLGTPVASHVGQATDAIGDYGLGDFRNTGHPDLIAVGLSRAYSGGSEYILYMPANGDGTFGNATVTAATGAQGSIAIGDFNNDKALDFVAIGQGSGGTAALTPFLGNGDGTFRNGNPITWPALAQYVARVFIGDFNRDGNLDVLVYEGVNYTPPMSHVWEFLGKGDGSFQLPQELFELFYPMTLADIDGDQWLDVIRYENTNPEGNPLLPPSHPGFTVFSGLPSGGFAQGNSYSPYAGTALPVPTIQFGDPTTSSIAADLNGDGTPDLIAGQSGTASNSPTYAQLLMGNGDGTFTPTYDVFPFWVNYPSYVHDLDGDGSADLVTVNGPRWSYYAFKGVPAPSLQLVLEQEQLSTNSSCGWIYPNVPDSSDRTVSLSSSVPGVIVPSTVTIAAGALAQRFCYTLDDSTFDWHQVFDIQAQLGTDVAVAYASPKYVYGFTLDLSPNTKQTLWGGLDTSPVTITLSSLHGYSGTVHLSCAGVPSGGGSCTLGTDTLNIAANGQASTTVVVHTLLGWDNSVAIYATDGTVNKIASFDVSVVHLVANLFGEFSGTTSGTAVAQVFATGIPRFNVTCLGLPEGASCRTSQTSYVYPSENTITITADIASTVIPGTYPFTIQVAGGPQSLTLAATLSVGDFRISPPPADKSWGIPGQYVYVPMNAQALGPFTWVINVSCTSDFGVTCSGYTNPGTDGQVHITIPSDTAPGAYHLNVTGAVASDIHSYTFPFTVADYNGTVSSTSLTIGRGQSGSVKATINGTAGFAASVILQCTGGTPAITCAFSPSSVSLSGTTPQTVTVTLTSSAVASAHPSTFRMWKEFAAIVCVLPFGVVFCFSKGENRWLKRIGALMLIVVAGSMLSCGGGGQTGFGNGGSLPPATYTVTIQAVASGTETMRDLGKVNVTVTR